MDIHNYAPELIKFSEAAQEGTLDAEKLKELEVLLSGSEEACQQWLELMRFHADLNDLVALCSAEKAAIAGLEASNWAPSGEAKRADRTGLFGMSSRMGFAVMATAATILVAVSTMWWNLSDQDEGLPGGVTALNEDDLYQVVRLPFHVAKLVDSTDAVWQSKGEIQVGRFFAEGDSLTLESGTAQISMVSGADIVLQAPCALDLVSERVVRLAKGKVTVQVADWASGFVLETQGLRVTDLGTRFAVSAEAPDAVEAHVLEGSVLIEPDYLRKEKDAKLLLVSGEAIRVGKEVPLMDRLKADRERFVDELAAFHPYRQIEIHNTGQGLEIGEEDPHWSITKGSPSLGPLPRLASVNPPHPRYSDNAPETSQWISFEQGTTEGVLNYARKNEIITFATSVDLTGFDPSTVSITAQVLADNGVQAIRLNGKPVKMASWADDRFRQMFCEFREIVIDEGFQVGVNEIEFDVINLPIRPPKKVQLNALALRVEWQAFGRPLPGI